MLRWDSAFKVKSSVCHFLLIYDQQHLPMIATPRMDFQGLPYAHITICPHFRQLRSLGIKAASLVKLVILCWASERTSATSCWSSGRNQQGHMIARTDVTSYSRSTKYSLWELTKVLKTENHRILQADPERWFRTLRVYTAPRKLHKIYKKLILLPDAFLTRKTTRLKCRFLDYVL